MKRLASKTTRNDSIEKTDEEQMHHYKTLLTKIVLFKLHEKQTKLKQTHSSAFAEILSKKPCLHTPIKQDAEDR